MLQNLQERRSLWWKPCKFLWSQKNNRTANSAFTVRSKNNSAIATRCIFWPTKLIGIFSKKRLPNCTKKKAVLPNQSGYNWLLEKSCIINIAGTLLDANNLIHNGWKTGELQVNYYPLKYIERNKDQQQRPVGLPGEAKRFKRDCEDITGFQMGVN